MDSSSSKVIRYGLVIWNSIPSKDGIPLCYILTTSWTHQPRYPVGTRVSLLGAKWLDHEADHPSPFSIWSFTNTPQYISMVWCLGTQILTIFMDRTSISVLKLIFLNKRWVFLNLHCIQLTAVLIISVILQTCKKNLLRHELVTLV
jgi:hypothetical protein